MTFAIFISVKINEKRRVSYISSDRFQLSFTTGKKLFLKSLLNSFFSVIYPCKVQAPIQDSSLVHMFNIMLIFDTARKNVDDEG